MKVGALIMARKIRRRKYRIVPYQLESPPLDYTLDSAGVVEILFAATSLQGPVTGDDRIKPWHSLRWCANAGRGEAKLDMVSASNFFNIPHSENRSFLRDAASWLGLVFRKESKFCLLPCNTICEPPALKSTREIQEPKYTTKNPSQLPTTPTAE